MKKFIFKYILLLSVLPLLFGSCENGDDGRLFKLMGADHTGIGFVNTLTPNDSLNILDFEYMFNGGGVGVLDVNNDGLPDLYFTGNQVSGRLYLNKGNLKFEDITTSAQVGTSGWSNGVSITDVNQDGFQDIYISKGGPRGTPNKEMENLLFVNNGDNTFTEKAKQFGIADIGYSIQALFFDFDRDGHKDLYLLTNALVDYSRNVSRPKINTGKAVSTDRLYKNNGDHTFTDVSQQSGIVMEGFGLGISLCDVNDDGWPDVYVSNDFITNDLLYINQQDGTFKNEIEKYLKHQSFNGMGIDIADINNDAASDILVMDMLPDDNARLKQTVGYFSYDKFQLDERFGYQPQFVRNTLQLNNGNSSYSEIGQLAGIYNTDWSWAPLIADFDNDGWKDIYITNGYRKDVTNLDFIDYGRQNVAMGTPEALQRQKRARLNDLPEVKLSNYMFRNDRKFIFKNTAKEWGLDYPSYSNGAAYVDLDLDGDLDIVVNNIDDPAFIFKNTLYDSASKTDKKPHYLNLRLSGFPNAESTKILVKNGKNQQEQMFSTVRGYLSTIGDVVHFGLGRSVGSCSIEVIWPDGRTQSILDSPIDTLMTLHYGDAISMTPKNSNTNQTLFREVSDSLGLTYIHQEDDFIDITAQPTLMHFQSRMGPAVAVGDIDGDGREDFFVGSAAGTSGKFFIQTANGFIGKEFAPDRDMEDMGILFLDVDGDGDQDLLLASSGLKANPKKTDPGVQVFLNDGKGGFSPGQKLNSGNSSSTLVAADMDRDGDLDIFAGAQVVPGNYPLAPESRLYVNENGRFVDDTQRIFGKKMNIGMVTSALWSDFDNDGQVDLMVVGEFMQPLFYKNEKGRLRNVTSITGLMNMHGWWNSIVAGDFDKDGDMDYVLGNLGLNSSHRATASEPIRLYAKDFDKNGSIDPIMTCYRNGNEQIVHSRTILIQQISAMRGRFKTYDSYAQTPFDSSFTTEELDGAMVLKAETLESVFLENLGQGKFKGRPLPVEAQIFPIYGMQVDDYDQDGNLDVFLVGNSYGTEVLSGQYDAGNGLLLKGNAKNAFEPVSMSTSGIHVGGDAKALAKLVLENGKNLYLASQNSGPLQAYMDTVDVSDNIQVKPKDDEFYAMIHFKDGSLRKIEFDYGSGYLSQSTRGKSIDRSKVDTIDFYSYLGKKRTLAIEEKPLQ